MIEILYKDKNAVVVNKPIGIPSQSDLTGDADLMSLTSAALSELGEDSRLWLIHRLDRNVGGAIVFARNKRTAAELSAAVAADGLCKTYFAVCHGNVTSGEYRDFLFKDSKANKAYVVKSLRKGAKEAVLTATEVATAQGLTLVRVQLHTGRFHQIRAQLASRGNPLVGDKKYGSRDLSARVPSLFASRLSFTLFGRDISLSVSPPTETYPWNIFDKESYKL